MVKASPSSASIAGLIPGWKLRSHLLATKNPKHKQNEYCNKFNKGFQRNLKKNKKGHSEDMTFSSDLSKRKESVL